MAPRYTLARALTVAAVALILAALVPAASWAAPTRHEEAPGAVPPAVQIVPDIDEEHLRELVDFVLSDATRRGSIAEYWSGAFSTVSPQVFREPAAYHEYEDGSGPSNACLGSPEEATGNAFYCPDDESISWDIDLLRSMYGMFGDASPVAVLAHEWGHHVQGMAGFPTVDKAAELQADCYAGMYLRYLDELGALDEEDTLEALALFHSIGDDKLAPGDVRDWFDRDVHGDSQERTQAQGIGFATGDAEYCLGYALWADRPPTEIADAVTLRQPPGAPVTVRSDGWVFELPGATITARTSPPGPAASPEDALALELRAMAPAASLALGAPTESMLEARGWATGDGVRSRFDQTSEDGSIETGVAEVLLDAHGATQAFVAVAPEDAGPGGADRAEEALDALLWGYCDPTSRQPVPCPSRSGGGSSPRVAPLPTPEIVQTIESTPRPKIKRRELEQRLLDRMVFGSCKPWRERSEERDPFSFGARAAVQCDNAAFGIKQASMYIFPDRRSMKRYWRYRLGRIEPKPPRRSVGCEAGNAAIQDWSHGEVVCYVSRASTPRRAKIRRIDKRTNTYGILDGDTRSIEDLYQWWSVIAG